jgi:tetratricopeptide (TPR) repeat protein
MKRSIVSLIFAACLSFTAFAQSLEQGLRDLDFEKYEAARTVFRVLVVKEPNNGNYWYYLGQTSMYLLNLDSAEICYKQGVSVEPANPANYAGLGELQLFAEDKIKAKEFFDKALSFSKSRAGIITDITAITIVSGSMVNNATTKMIEEAEKLVVMGYEQDKKNYNLLVAAGDVFLEKNDGGTAATFYERAIAIDPKNPKAYTRVSEIWKRVKNFETAQTDLNRAFDKDPNYAPAWKMQAEVYYAQRKFESAKNAYATYLKNSEPSISNQIRFARILFLSQEYAEALEKINEIQKIDKENLLLYRLRGFSICEVTETKPDVELAKSGLASLEFYLSKTEEKKYTVTDFEYLAKLQAKVGGKDSLAIQNIKKAMEMNPYNADLYVDMAKLYNKMRKFDSAVVNYEIYMGKAKKVNAADFFLYGKAAYFAKQYTKADSAFAKVSEMKADYPDAYLWRGNANVSMDPDFKTDLPKQYYEKYISLLTADPEKFETSLKMKNKAGLINAYDYLGFYYLNKKMKPEAKTYYQKVLELDPNNTKAKTALSEQLK